MRVRSARTTSAIALVAVATALTGCGGSSKPATPPPPKRPPVPRVGDTLRVRTRTTTLAVTVSRVIEPLRRSGVVVAPGDRSVGVLVAVRNLGRALYDSTAEGDFSIYSTRGERAQVVFVPHGRCATAEFNFLKQIAPHERRTGCVAFALPGGGRPRLVRFSPDGGRGRPTRSWLVSG